MKKYLLTFFLIILVSFSVSAHINGDVDGNNRVDSNDYILVRKHLLKSMVLSGINASQADVNGDGIISSLDYIKIRKILIYGIPTPVPTVVPTPKPTHKVTITPTVVPTPTFKIDNFPYYYRDATADLTIEKKVYNSINTNKKTTYYVIHLVLKDFKRLHTALTKYTRGSDGLYQTQKISDAASQNSAILALEGDYKVNSNYGTIKDGVFYSGKSLDPSKITTNKGCFGYYNSATGVLGDCKKLSSKNFAEAINSKEVTDTFRFGGNLLEDGVIKYKVNTSEAHRQANFVGYVKPGEFYFIVSEGAAYSDSTKPSDGTSYGLLRYEKGEILKNLGCSFGTQLDGGQSVIIWFMGKKLQSKIEIRNERDWLTDYIFFK